MTQVAHNPASFYVKAFDRSGNIVHGCIGEHLPLKVRENFSWFRARLNHLTFVYESFTFRFLLCAMTMRLITLRSLIQDTGGSKRPY